jgi:hypothetical protein
MDAGDVMRRAAFGLKGGRAKRQTPIWSAACFQVPQWRKLRIGEKPSPADKAGGALD